MADFRYNCNNNATRNQNIFKLIANNNAADNDMIALTEEPLSCWKNPKNEWKILIVNLESKTHQLLLLPKYNKTQVNSLLNVSMLFLFLSSTDS